MEFEKFLADVTETNGVLRVTIPYKISEYMGLKVKDRVVVLVRKAAEDDV